VYELVKTRRIGGRAEYLGNEGHEEGDNSHQLLRGFFQLLSLVRYFYLQSLVSCLYTCLQTNFKSAQVQSIAKNKIQEGNGDLRSS
jgi:hypothetical protein